MELNQEFWDQRYVSGQTGWDLGEACPAFVHYFSQDRNRAHAILIPGAGNAHEADMLLKLGYTNLTIVDIAPTVVNSLQEKYAGRSEIQIICSDFLVQEGSYDLILEQTFFCALDPSLRNAYVEKMAELLTPGGLLVGVLFDRDFEGGPPFGGHADEYRALFTPYFELLDFSTCTRSAAPRAGSELFIRMRKRLVL